MFGTSEGPEKVLEFWFRSKGGVELVVAGFPPIGDFALLNWAIKLF